VQHAKKAAGADRLISETQLEYVLVTGANWAGPIKDFRLVVDKGEPVSLVSFCATGVKKIGATQFEVRYKDYTPDRNLQVLIMHRPQ
jgi:Na+-transporting NADH:ubiquinone oxidoreductase subunit NqrF